MNYEKIKQIPLSGEEVLYLTNGKAEIITYQQLKIHENIYTVMGPYRACILLIETRQNYGHWVCFFEKENGNIEYFDSYGYFPDDELEFINEKFRKENGEWHSELLRKLYNSGRKIEYNDYRLQGPKTSTCGRWCALRINHKDMSIEEFAKLFINKVLSPDDILVRI